MTPVQVPLCNCHFQVYLHIVMWFVRQGAEGFRYVDVTATPYGAKVGHALDEWDWLAGPDFRRGKVIIAECEVVPGVGEGL